MPRTNDRIAAQNVSWVHPERADHVVLGEELAELGEGVTHGASDLREGGAAVAAMDGRGERHAVRAAPLGPGQAQASTDGGFSLEFGVYPVPSVLAVTASSQEPSSIISSIAALMSSHVSLSCGRPTP